MRSLGWSMRAALVFASALSQPLHAQIVQGYVLQEKSGRAVAEVHVQLLESGRDSVLASSTTGTNGAFLLRAPAIGSYRIRAELLGYATTVAAVQLSALNEVVTVEVRIAENAIPLNPVRVVAQRLEPYFMGDLRDRQKLGFGAYIMREELDARIGQGLAQVLESVPGVRVIGEALVATRTAIMDGTDDCYAAIYLDGVRQFSADLIRYRDREGVNTDREAVQRLIELFKLPISLMEAIEVYKGVAQVPGIFGGPTGGCGVIAIWMRRSIGYGDDYEPPDYGIRLQGTYSLGPSALHLGGRYAPVDGPAAELTLQWPLRGALTGGLHLRTSWHRLPAAVTADITSMLPNRYVEPPGSRLLLLFTAGAESRLVLPPVSGLHPVLTARAQLAQRRFTLRSSDAGNPLVHISSFGVGPGAGIAVGKPIGASSMLTVGVSADLLRFSRYGHIDRPWNNTAATWHAVGLTSSVTRRM